METVKDLQQTTDDHVTTLVLRRPPHNFVDIEFIKTVADRLDALDKDPNCRVIVLAADGRSFCAGADFGNVASGGQKMDSEIFYAQAMRLFRTSKPIVAAIQGPAIGAGVGLALVADFRIACPSSRFSVNFNRIGFHPGFGLSFTLPRLIGAQQAARLFYTGERIDGERATAIGLTDELVPDEDVRARAHEFAREIAVSAPLAVQSTRTTLRLGLAKQVEAITARELAIQLPQFQSCDFIEGVTAAAQRRPPVFTGK